MAAGSLSQVAVFETCRKRQADTYSHPADDMRDDVGVVMRQLDGPEVVFIAIAFRRLGRGPEVGR